MENITIRDKYDFEEFINVLLKNGYSVNATAEINIEDDVDILFYIVNYQKL